MTIQTDGLLFELVQLLQVFGDSKTFPDAIALHEAEEIEQEVLALARGYGASLAPVPAEAADRDLIVLQAARQHFALRYQLEELVNRHFVLSGKAQGAVPRSDSMEQHIERMWDWLTRRPEDRPERSTLIPLNHPCVVPGGRYGEFYYWDSYFTAVGLLASGRIDRLQDMVDNVADLIRTVGFAPNGTRTYYASRSQIPFFGHMLRLLAKAQGEAEARARYDILKAEHAFWNREDGSRLIELGGGRALNRYWDAADTPRPEGYREDLNTWYAARSSGLPQTEMGRVFRDLRAAAESGWDFSSRWLKKDAAGRWHLSSIRTTSILPIDLNCLLYSMERQLAQWAPNEDDRRDYLTRAEQRRQLLLAPPFWDEASGWFYDAEFTKDGDLTSTGIRSIAGVLPLFCQLAGRDHAEKVARVIEREFLQGGGVVSTTQEHRSGQQWDYPNGWAPLQWVTVVGLLNYGYDDLAREIAQRFVAHARSVFGRTGKMMEKYDVCDLDREGGGGEYPNQDGFAWTNAIVKAFIEFLNGNVFWQ